jgi:hypothetical protein
VLRMKRGNNLLCKPHQESYHADHKADYCVNDPSVKLLLGWLLVLPCLVNPRSNRIVGVRTLDLVELVLSRVDMQRVPRVH